ncbi:MAG: hypothetical protein HETSPECPRED_004683 [Heterodermia speciosa]|uniref:Uncharacterized protein n=1 Tax=Heterodermia speciosa TaxID=116794 RepID=A0A8H3FC63_9LECA|nr:MAG: hypothetical protein HETSPECPRED_004683 [Heterodermia speciosa]
MNDNVSHGRGGAGNLVPDDTPYADGEIVREGPTGDQGDGAYSAGRGGAGNIDSPKVKPTKPGSTHDNDVIPETAVHEAGSEHQNYHVGRGGEGNAHHDPDSTATHKGLADKLKDKIFGKK